MASNLFYCQFDIDTVKIDWINMIKKTSGSETKSLQNFFGMDECHVIALKLDNPSFYLTFR